MSVCVIDVNDTPDVVADEVGVGIQSSTPLHSRESDSVELLQLWHYIRHQAEDNFPVPLTLQNDH